MPAAARKHRADEESHGTSAVPNPYSGPGPDLSSNLLIDKMKRLVYIGVSLYFLQRMAFWSAIVQSPHIRHEWFKIGLATAIGKSYCKNVFL